VPFGTGQSAAPALSFSRGQTPIVSSLPRPDFPAVFLPPWMAGMPKMQEHFSAMPSPDGSGGVIVALTRDSDI